MLQNRVVGFGLGIAFGSYEVGVLSGTRSASARGDRCAVWRFRDFISVQGR